LRPRAELSISGGTLGLSSGSNRASNRYESWRGAAEPSASSSSRDDPDASHRGGCLNRLPARLDDPQKHRSAMDQAELTFENGSPLTSRDLRLSIRGAIAEPCDVGKQISVVGSIPQHVVHCRSHIADTALTNDGGPLTTGWPPISADKAWPSTGAFRSPGESVAIAGPRTEVELPAPIVAMANRWDQAATYADQVKRFTWPQVR
jgi:hypothetical protein